MHGNIYIYKTESDLYELQPFDSIDILILFTLYHMTLTEICKEPLFPGIPEVRLNGIWKSHTVYE